MHLLKRQRHVFMHIALACCAGPCRQACVEWIAFVADSKALTEAHGQLAPAISSLCLTLAAGCAASDTDDHSSNGSSKNRAVWAREVLRRSKAGMPLVVAACSAQQAVLGDVALAYCEEEREVPGQLVPQLLEVVHADKMVDAGGCPILTVVLPHIDCIWTVVLARLMLASCATFHACSLIGDVQRLDLPLLALLACMPGCFSSPCLSFMTLAFDHLIELISLSWVTQARGCCAPWVWHPARWLRSSQGSSCTRL